MFPIIIILFIVATLSQGSALYFVSRRQSEEYKDRRKKWWLLHYIFNGALWLVLLALIIWLQFTAERFESGLYAQLAGGVFLITGLILSRKSMAVLGLENAMGRRFFFPEESGEIRSSIYGFLNNPMYDGFILIFLGLGLLLGIQEDFQLALVSVILLNSGLAVMENYRISWNIF